MIRTVLLLAALLCVLTIHAADARIRTGHNRAEPSNRVETGIPASSCSDPTMRPCVDAELRSVPVKRRRNANRTENFTSAPGNIGTAYRAMPPGLRRVMAEGAGRVVAHPSGCPRRAFCACGAAVRIFGKPIRSLWLAAEWLRRFPRAQAARGMAAVRRDGHHIVVLEEHISGALWRVYDANSGRHRTRVHLRSIAGWTIVDPRG